MTAKAAEPETPVEAEIPSEPAPEPVEPTEEESPTPTPPEPSEAPVEPDPQPAPVAPPIGSVDTSPLAAGPKLTHHNLALAIAATPKVPVYDKLLIAENIADTFAIKDREGFVTTATGFPEVH